MKNSNISKDENKFLFWGFIFSIAIYKLLSERLGQPELAKNILYVFGIGAALMLLGKLFRRMK